MTDNASKASTVNLAISDLENSTNEPKILPESDGSPEENKMSRTTLKEDDGSPNQNPPMACLEEPHSVYSATQRWAIVGLASIAGTLSSLTGTTFFPIINEIQTEFSVSPYLVNLSLTLFMLTQGGTTTIWSAMSDTWGRRPVFLIMITIFLCSTIVLAMAPSFWYIFGFRILQAIGASSPRTMGTGIIADISVPSERGGYIGLYTMCQMVSSACGPTISGVIAGTFSWRAVFWFAFIYGGTIFITVLLLLPETLRALVGNGSGCANQTPIQWIRRRLRQRKHDDMEMAIETCPRTTKFVWPNFKEPFLYMVQPDIALIFIFHGLHFGFFFCFQAALPTVYQKFYGLNTMQIGLNYLPQGAGCILGSILEGHILDRHFQTVMRRLNIPNDVVKKGCMPLDFPIYKTRLHTTWVSSVLLQTITIVYGWSLKLKAPIILIEVLQFGVGYCTSSIVNDFQTLLVDLYPTKGASICASSILIRQIFASIGIGIVAPGMDTMGVQWMFTAIGLLLFSSNIMIAILWKYGVRWRNSREERPKLLT